MQNPVLDFLLSAGFWLGLMKTLAPVLVWLVAFGIAVLLGVFRRPTLAPWKWAVFIGGLTIGFALVAAPGA